MSDQLPDRMRRGKRPCGSARRVDVPDAGEPVDARELSDDPSALADVIDERTVFGRVTPRQKRAFVTALQQRDHVVAMTGDGVNDALALKDADIGVAMGSGAPATRAVAQLVLLDGRFSHMPDVVAEGRRVWAEQAARPGLEAMRMRSRVSESEALLDPSGLGGFTVAEWRAGGPDHA